MTEVEAYIEKQRPEQRKIIERLREIIRKTHPDIEEKIKWGVLGYADGAYYIVALKDHVNVGFSLKKIPKEKQGLLDAVGKETGHVGIKSADGIDEKRIKALLTA